MADTTAISWADSTWNPWVGCSKVSPGCAHCYAEVWALRHGDGAIWGDDGVRRVTSAANWRKPVIWQRDAATFAAENDGRRRRVFCASLADVFEPRSELVEPRLLLLELILRTPDLDWLILTKRPEFARDWLRRWYHDFRAESGGPPLDLYGHRDWRFRDQDDVPSYDRWSVLPNIWIGTSIENSRHTWRADALREIPAAVRFISAEPLLGSLFPQDRVRQAPGDAREQSDDDSQDDPTAASGATTRDAQSGPEAPRAKGPLDLTGIDWVIVGGESGPGYREMNHDWAREILDACIYLGQRDLDEAYLLGAPDDVIAEGIRDEIDGRDRPAFFFKQSSGPRPGTGTVLDGRTWVEFPTPFTPALPTEGSTVG